MHKNLWCSKRSLYFGHTSVNPSSTYFWFVAVLAALDPQSHDALLIMCRFFLVAPSSFISRFLFSHLIRKYNLQSTTCNMASSTDNLLFTAWDSSPLKSDLAHFQDIINYCASRFTVAAMTMANCTDMTEEQSKIHLGLFARELVCLSVTLPRPVNRCNG